MSLEPPDVRGEEKDRSAVRERPRRRPAHLLFASLTQDVADWIAVMSTDGTIQMSGGAIAAHTGLSSEAILGMPFIDLVEPGHRDLVLDTLRQVSERPRSRQTVRYQLVQSRGAPLGVESVVVNQADSPFVSGVVITTRRTIQGQRATSRSALSADSRAALVRHAQSLSDLGERYALLTVNVTNYHHIAAGIGSDAAGRVIEGLCDLIRPVLRPDDLVSQSGTASLAILLRGAEDERVVAAFVERLRPRLRSPLRVVAQDVLVSLSFGHSINSGDAETAESVLADAEAASQAARGPQRVTSRPGDRDDYRRSLRLAAGLPRAVQRSELQARFQPVVRLDTGTIAGFEALCRWAHPELGLLLPSEFIPLAESLDWIAPLDRWMIGEACRQMASWAAPDSLWLSVNVSARHLSDTQLADVVGAELGQAGLRPGQLHLEVTENALADNEAQALRVLERLRGLGVRVAIDDFGTGYGSLGQLSTMPVYGLKLDQSFVGRLHEGPGRSLVHGVIAMAHELELQVVAEGVETEEQVEALRALGCDFAQGFFFSRPLRSLDVAAMLAVAPRW